MIKTKGFILFPIILIGSLLLLIIFLFINSSNNRNTQSRENIVDNSNINKDKLLLLTGMIWTSGLMDQEKEILNIDSDYQIVKALISKGWEDKVTGMYLLTDSVINFSTYLGKCVTIKGVTKSSWENLIKKNYEINGKWTYNRSAIVVKDIDTNDIGLCIGDYDRTIKDQKTSEGLEYKTAKGTLSFAKRPAPDISYDLEIILDEPFIDELNASGNPILTKRLDISSGSDEIYKQLISYVGMKVQISGYMEWGYAESRFLKVDKLKVI